MKNLLLGLFAVFSLALNAQKSLVFKNELQPNRTYKTMMVTLNKMVMDMGELGQGQGPMTMDQDMRIGLTMKTGADQGANGFPLTMTYDSLAIKMSMNGADMPIPPDDTLSKMKIVGLYKEGGFNLDEEKSENVTPDMKESLTQTMKEVYDKVKFPTSPLGIGDSFENSYPMDLPVPGGQPITMNVKNDFKLIALDGSIGTFEVLQDLNFSGANEGFDMVASGKGKGIMKFDAANKTVLSYKVQLPMEMTMTMEGGMTMTMKMDSNTTVTQSIE